MAKPGRPTDYKPEYCEAIIELGRQGKSPAQMASHFDVSRQTIDNWALKHEEFLEALNRALAHCQAWWEDKGQSGLETPGFNAAIWKKSVEARFRDDYTERRDLAVNGTLDVTTKEQRDAAVAAATRADG